MSNFYQLHELLRHNQQLHARTGEFYNALSNKARNERVKLLYWHYLAGMR